MTGALLKKDKFGQIPRCQRKDDMKAQREEGHSKPKRELGTEPLSQARKGPTLLTP